MTERVIDTDHVIQFVEGQAEKISWLAKEMWDNPEVGLQEYYASRLLADELEKEGFTLQRGVADMPTAFIAEWGSGKPVIGLLAEYDALPGISQKVQAVKDAGQNRRSRPRLRAQPVRCRRLRCGAGCEGCHAESWHPGHTAFLRLPGRGNHGGQSVYGPRRRL